MNSIIKIIFFFLLFMNVNYGQVGIGAGGGLIYPGFANSDLRNSRFTVGAGYDIFIRHRLVKITKDHQLNAKYSVSNYFSDIDLSRVGKTRFTFSYLSVEAFTTIQTLDSIKMIVGAGLNLINATAIQDYFESNQSLLIPTFIVGAEYWFNKNYNVFGNLNYQLGKFTDNNQELPIYGLRFQLGATMFLTE